MVERATERATFAGAKIDVIALASIRATREAMVRADGSALPAIVGVSADHVDGEEIAVFPGDLPSDPAILFDDGAETSGGRSRPLSHGPDFGFVRFRPPGLVVDGQGVPALPHIRLDRAMQFLLGDRMR